MVLWKLRYPYLFQLELSAFLDVCPGFRLLDHMCYAVLSVTQSGPTLWDPMDCSLPGSSVHEDSLGTDPLLSTCTCVLSHSRVRLFATPLTVAHQAPLSTGFSRPGAWSGLPFPPPGNLLTPVIAVGSLISPVLAGRYFTTRATLAHPCQQCLIHAWISAHLRRYDVFPEVI